MPLLLDEMMMKKRKKRMKKRTTMKKVEFLSLGSEKDSILFFRSILLISFFLFVVDVVDYETFDPSFRRRYQEKEIFSSSFSLLMHRLDVSFPLRRFSLPLSGPFDPPFGAEERFVVAESLEVLSLQFASMSERILCLLPLLPFQSFL